jgi:uncharacterized membrane protein YdbT with pleckstrin-like domain
MNCSQCQAPLQPSDRYCRSCGRGVAPPDRGPAPGGGTLADPAEERQLWHGFPSVRSRLLLLLLWALVGGGFLLLLPVTGPAGIAGAVVAGLLFLHQMLLALRDRLTLRYRLTTQRLFLIRGFLSRIQNEIELIRVDDVEVRQGVIDRLWGIGTVRVVSTDRSHPELLLRSVIRPEAVKELIREYTQIRRKRSLHVESL